MPAVVVTGATGHLGRLVIESLLTRGVPAEDILATGRDLTKVKDFADRGVRTAHIDYGDAQSLRSAFDGAQKLLFISGSEVGQRIPQHTAVVDAATAAGVDLVVYTSAPYADTTSMLLAAEHKATEEMLRASGLPFAVLRNSWYLENYLAQIPTYLQLGAIHGAAGEGRISAAARSDYAEAAAAVLTLDDQAGAVYELGGDTGFTLTELAAAVTAATGTTVTYQNLSQADFEQVLVGAGLPAPFAAVLADVDRAVTTGALQVDTGDLSRLIGHPTQPLTEAIAAAL
jgi:NAD(P)H dehydrogenase (quinone)